MEALLSQNAALTQKILALKPWHMNVQLNEQLNTGQVFSDDGQILQESSDIGVSLLQLRTKFLRQIDSIYPEGLSGKRFLDCACNAGGYCFWTRERDIEAAYGFDVREHWISQAKFIQSARTIAPTDRIQFQVSDLYDLPKLELPKCDITMFKGIFYHLPDPVTGLKLAADMTNEVLFLDTATTWGDEDGFMKVGWECKEHVMSGVHGLKWSPTGPRVLANMLVWMGFVEMKLIYFKQRPNVPGRGRVEIVASKKKGLLEDLHGGYIKIRGKMD